MNLLSLKIRANQHIIKSLFLLCHFFISANANGTDNDLKEVYEKSDAFFQYSYTDISFARSFMSYRKVTTFESKLVINNKSGVEQFAFLELDRYIMKRLQKIQVMTIKADGTQVELDPDIVLEHKFENDQEKVFEYPISGVEPGDTIFTSYEYAVNLEDNQLSDFINLYKVVPSKNTEYSIRVNPGLLIRYKEYNGFPAPEIISNDTLVYCLFKMENVKGINENRHTCLSCELPYFYYSVEKKGNNTRSWKDVYNEEFNFMTQPLSIDYEKKGYYKKWKKRVLGDAVDSSKYHQLALLLEDIYANFEMGPIKREEIIKSTGYFLKEKRFDELSIKRLYRQILEDLGVKYWAVFARSKRLGKIDPYYIRKGEYDHVFFAYENGRGSLDLLYPHDIDLKYLTNEIPTALYNVKAVVARPFLTDKLRIRDKFISADFKMAEVDSVTIDIVDLPGMGANRNYMKQTYHCDMDVEKRDATFTSTFSVSGGLSTDMRSFFGMLEKDEEMNELYGVLAELEDSESSLEIDTVQESKLKYTNPFTFSVKAKGKVKDGLNYINDSTLSVTVGELLQHNQIESSDEDRELDYYLDFGYTDFYMFLLKFPCEVKLLGASSHNKIIKNEIGSYNFNADIVGNGQLIIRSSYRIDREKISKEHHDYLEKLNNLVDEAKNIRLLLRLSASNSER